MFSAACTYCSGKDEGMTDQMRSILAQFEFANLVLEWTSKGIPFQMHLYVPEVHPLTNMTCEREDEAHVLKVFFFLNINKLHVHVVHLYMHMYVFMNH